LTSGGIEPPHADSKYVGNSCSQFYSVLLRAPEVLSALSEFCAASQRWRELTENERSALVEIAILSGDDETAARRAIASG